MVEIHDYRAVLNASHMSRTDSGSYRTAPTAGLSEPESGSKSGLVLDETEFFLLSVTFIMYTVLDTLALYQKTAPEYHFTYAYQTTSFHYHILSKPSFTRDLVWLQVRVLGDLTGKKLQVTTSRPVGFIRNLVKYWEHQVLCITTYSSACSMKTLYMLTSEI